MEPEILYSSLIACLEKCKFKMQKKALEKQAFLFIIGAHLHNSIVHKPTLQCFWL